MDFPHCSVSCCKPGMDDSLFTLSVLCGYKSTWEIELVVIEVILAGRKGKALHYARLKSSELSVHDLYKHLWCNIIAFINSSTSPCCKYNNWNGQHLIIKIVVWQDNMTLKMKWLSAWCSYVLLWFSDISPVPALIVSACSGWKGNVLDRRIWTAWMWALFAHVAVGRLQAGYVTSKAFKMIAEPHPFVNYLYIIHMQMSPLFTPANTGGQHSSWSQSFVMQYSKWSERTEANDQASSLPSTPKQPPK